MKDAVIISVPNSVLKRIKIERINNTLQSETVALSDYIWFWTLFTLVPQRWPILLPLQSTLELFFALLVFLKYILCLSLNRRSMYEILEIFTDKFWKVSKVTFIPRDPYPQDCVRVFHSLIIYLLSFYLSTYKLTYLSSFFCVSSIHPPIYFLSSSKKLSLTNNSLILKHVFPPALPYSLLPCLFLFPFPLPFPDFVL